MTNPNSDSGVETLYAFWNYDTYPYFLCGTIAKMNDDGLVSIKEFGGARFKPVLILPVDAGKRLKKKLDFVRDTYQSELARAQRELERKTWQAHYDFVNWRRNHRSK